MNIETKLALAFLALFCVGLVLIAYGLGITSRLAACGLGIASTCAGVYLLGVILAGRR